MSQKARRSDVGSNREKCRFFQDSMGGLADEYRNDLRNLADESPVILVTVRDDQAEKGVVRVVEPEDRRKRHRFVWASVDRPAHIEYQSPVSRFNLDAGATYFSGSAMNSDSHRSSRTMAASVGICYPCGRFHALAFPRRW